MTVGMTSMAASEMHEYNVPVTGAPLETEIQRHFARDMHDAGFVVNWFTMLDGTRTPSVYGNKYVISISTSLKLGFRSFGDNTVAWPLDACMV